MNLGETRKGAGVLIEIVFRMETRVSEESTYFIIFQLMCHFQGFYSYKKRQTLNESSTF